MAMSFSAPLGTMISAYFIVYRYELALITYRSDIFIERGFDKAIVRFNDSFNSSSSVHNISLQPSKKTNIIV